jgi:hypothetical protein
MTMTKQPTNVVSFPAAAPAKAEASHVRIWSKPVVALGYTALPSVMIQAQRRLGITPLQFNILAQLLDYWREPSRAPFPSKAELAERIGVKPKTIQTNIRALEKAQLVTREMRRTAAGDWNSTLSPRRLVARIRRWCRSSKLRGKSGRRPRRRRSGRRRQRPEAAALKTSYPGRMSSRAEPGCPRVEITETLSFFKSLGSPMPSPDDIEAALSLERFGRYVAWTGGDRRAAVELYSLNARISEALYIPVHGLEIALRNRIHTVMTEADGERWFDTDGLLVAPHQKDQLTTAVAEIEEAGKEATAGRIVAALTFSFWTAMLSPAYETLWRATLNRIAETEEGKRLPAQKLLAPAHPDPPASQPHRPS